MISLRLTFLFSPLVTHCRKSVELQLGSLGVFSIMESPFTTLASGVACIRAGLLVVSAVSCYALCSLGVWFGFLFLETARLLSNCEQVTFGAWRIFASPSGLPPAYDVRSCYFMLGFRIGWECPTMLSDKTEFTSPASGNRRRMRDVS
jgi:hypothetical protein